MTQDGNDIPGIALGVVVVGVAIVVHVPSVVRGILRTRPHVRISNQAVFMMLNSHRIEVKARL